jgi:hypothetical protein
MRLLFKTFRRSAALPPSAEIPTVFATKILINGSFADVGLNRDIRHDSAGVALLSKYLSSSFDDLIPFFRLLFMNVNQLDAPQSD